MFAVSCLRVHWLRRIRCVFYYILTRPFHCFLVAELVGALGCEDAAIAYLLPCYIGTMHVFLRQVEAGDVVRWPVPCMSPVKRLYTYDRHSARFVCAFVKLVLCKVERILDFAERVKEGLEAPPPVSDAARKRIKDPSLAGGACFYNGGEPRAALPEYASGSSKDNNQEGQCNKTVCPCRSRDVATPTILPGLACSDTPGTLLDRSLPLTGRLNTYQGIWWLVSSSLHGVQSRQVVQPHAQRRTSRHMGRGETLSL